MNILKNNNSLYTSLLVSALLAFNSTEIQAHEINTNQCNLSINNDLSVTPEHVRIIEDDQTLIDIYQNKILFIKGKQIPLTDAQQSMVLEYSSSIRSALPEVTKIAVDAVGLAFQGLNVALGDIVDMTDKKQKFEQLQQKINDKYQGNEGRYSITKGEFNLEIDDQEIDVLIEDIVEDMVPSLVGSLVTKIGQAIASGEDIDIELDGLGDKIEQEVEAKVELIEVRADAFCQKMKQLDELEKKLVESNHEFADLDLLEIDH